MQKNNHIGVLLRKAHSLTAMAAFYVNSQSNGVGKTPVEIVEFAYQHHPVEPRQVRNEILRFARLVHERRPKTLVEIGTHAGGTFFVLCRCADPAATVISIDLPGARFSGRYPKFIKTLLPRMPLPSQTLCCLRADSHHQDSVHWLEKVLNGRQVDLMFIDGDHAYAGVKQDFEMYSPFVRRGGLVAFHDIVKHAQDTGSEVDVWWNEIKKNYNHEEFIEDPDQGWAGIGVLYV